MSNVSVAKLNRAIRSLLRCTAGGCPIRTRLEFHHIRETKLAPNGNGRGRNARIYDVVNRADAYLPFCHRHHKLIHDAKSDSRWVIVDVTFIELRFGLQSPVRPLPLLEPPETEREKGILATD